MPVQDFYAENHLDTSDGFGSTLNRPHPHRGFDINGWPEGTPIPAWSPGTVERVYWSSVLGNVVVVHTDFGWVGYCHLVAASVSEGQWINEGDTIGALGQTGSAAAGPHLHTTVSETGNDPGSSAVIDPLPYIRQYRDGAPTPSPIPHEKKRKPKMLMCHVLQGASDKVSPKFAIFAPGFYFEFEGQDAANAWISQIGSGPSASVTAGTLELIKTAALAGK